jgi:diacylglycerol kinase (ATP)
MACIGVIINPKSRLNRNNPARMEALRRQAEKVGLCAVTRSVDELHDAAVAFRDAGVDVLAIAGGDGSNHHTLTMFNRVYGGAPLPVVAFLRGGTMNTVSQGCGIAGTPEKILAEVAAAAAGDEPMTISERSTVSIEGNIGFIFGNGLIHNFLNEYYATGDPSPLRGATTLARVAWSAVLQGELIARVARPFVARVVVDGQRWDREQFVAIMASTQPEIGLGFTPFFRSREVNNALHVVGIHGSMATVVAQLPKLYRGEKAAESVFTETLAQEVVFECDEPLLYTIDGDTYRGGAVTRLSCGPLVRLFIPRGGERRAGLKRVAPLSQLRPPLPVAAQPLRLVAGT